MTQIFSIATLRATCKQGACQATFLAQIEEINRKESTTGKPFYELKLRDASDCITLRVWSDNPVFPHCETLITKTCLAIEGEFFHHNPFGIDGRRWSFRPLSDHEYTDFFEGPEEFRRSIEADVAFITAEVENLQDPRLRALGLAFLQQFGTRFQRAAAARHNHHARRGGLVQHTAQMLRTAIAICMAYPHLNRDLLITGVLFHDTGKLWETCPANHGFTIDYTYHGELMGHINIGVELINMLWRDLPKDSWEGLSPKSDDVRLHLIHLVLSHHGELEFGSPVPPKTPEAVTLHYIDNLDARLEMFAMGYATQSELAPGIFDRVRPLHVHPVASLAKFILPEPLVPIITATKDSPAMETTVPES